MHIRSLKNKHIDSDIIVAGSGASIDYFDRDFFNNRIVIGTNYIHQSIKCDYIVTKDIDPDSLYKNVSCKIITSKFDRGSYDRKSYDIDNNHYYVFNHKNNTTVLVDYTVIGTDDIIVSWSTITSAMHIAAYMGAKTIFLVGTDGCKINGKLNCKLYRRAIERGDDWYNMFINKSRNQIPELKIKLKEYYGCHTYMISPFTNFKFDGNVVE